MQAGSAALAKESGLILPSKADSNIELALQGGLTNINPFSPKPSVVNSPKTGERLTLI